MGWASPSTGSFGLRAGGEAQLGDRAAAVARAEGELTAVLARQRPGDREAEPRAALLRRDAGPEDRVADRGVEPPPEVEHAQDGRRGGRLRLQRHLRLARARVDR